MASRIEACIEYLVISMTTPRTSQDAKTFWHLLAAVKHVRSGLSPRIGSNQP
jgi:hypothetical protein